MFRFDLDLELALELDLELDLVPELDLALDPDLELGCSGVQRKASEHLNAAL